MIRCANLTSGQDAAIQESLQAHSSRVAGDSPLSRVRRWPRWGQQRNRRHHVEVPCKNALQRRRAPQQAAATATSRDSVLESLQESDLPITKSLSNSEAGKVLYCSVAR